MKKSLSQAIAVATLLGAAASAQATIAVNDKGLGGALLYPLYTVENGASTLVSVVNTTDKAKAVKIRFVEAMNSAEVLDFHLYMSPKDVWSGAIVATANGAKLMSNDTSCIAGYSNGFPAEGLEFSDLQIQADIANAKSDATHPQVVTGANGSLARTRVGHFEVIEMGEINGATDTSFGADGGAISAANPAIKLEAAITHVVKDGKRVPAGCGAVTAEWNKAGGMWNGVFTANDDQASAVAGLTPPAGGLYGTAAIVNVPASWSASYDAVALGDDVTGGLYATPQHPRPGSIYPNLATVGADATGVMGDAALTAVSGALAVDSVYNDYYVDQDFGAETDMVLTFPTKRFYVNRHEATAGLTPPEWLVVGGVTQGQGGDIKLTAGPGFGVDDYFFNAWNANTNKACEYMKLPTVYDTEEAKEVVDDGFISPRPIVVGKLPLCYETNVVSLNNSNTFGADLVRTSLKTPYKAGWIDLTKDAAYTNGLPVIGFTNIVTKNGASGGVMRNFSQTFKHKTE